MHVPGPLTWCHQPRQPIKPNPLLRQLQRPVVTAMAKELSQRFSNMEKALRSYSTQEELAVLTLEELRTRTIKFGKTKVGQTYAEVVASDPGYCTWFLGSYGDSKKDSHREFVRFLELHTEHMEEALNIPCTKFNPARIVSQEQSQATRKGRDQGLQGDWEAIPIGEFVGPRRGCGGRRLVTSGSVRSSPSGGTDQSREQHGGRIVADHAPADADATSDGPRKSPVISSMQQGHMIDKVCEGLNAYIHYMGKCSPKLPGSSH